MTRARANGEDEERFGHTSRGLVKKFDALELPWTGFRANIFESRDCLTWREALDYALGLDPEG